MTDGLGNVEPDPAGVMGRTTLQMKTLWTFTAAGWDFDTPIWTIDEWRDYPQLAWDYEPVIAQRAKVVNKTRVGRTVYRYECRLEITNTASVSIFDVAAELTEAPENLVIIDGNVGFAEIAPLSQAESEDTFIIEVDRAVPIDAAEMVWKVTYSFDDGTGQITMQEGTSVIIMGLEGSGDIDGDGKVDYTDVYILAEQWLEGPGEPSADIAPAPEGDGIVDWLDFAELAGGWGWAG
jgi:hypothetical protein